MKIGKRKIGPDQPPFILAELSGNHNGELQNIFRLIDEAKLAGADAVKLQCYEPNTITMDCSNDDFIIKEGPWSGQTLYELYKEAHTPFSWMEPIFRYAREVRNIDVFASVFDETSVDTLEKLSPSAYKIASFELTDLPLIEYVAKTDRPVIISTGMGSRKEINDAINTFNRFSTNPELALLHCVSSYPASPKEANLPALGPLSALIGGHHVVGLSDHTLGVGVAAAGVAFGACIIEKHLCLSRSMGGPDSAFSLEPLEFTGLVRACREAWEACRPSLSKSQEANKQFRRSIYVVSDVCAGQVLSKEQVRVIRPAFGLQPRFYQSVLGRVAKVDLPAGTPLSLDHLVSQDE